VPSAILRFVYIPGSLLFVRISSARNGNLTAQPVVLGLRISGAEPSLPVTIQLPLVHKEKAYLNYTFKGFRDVIMFLPEYMTSHCRRRYSRIHIAVPTSVCVLHNHSIQAQLTFGYFASMRHPGNVWYPKGIGKPPPQVMWWAKHVIWV
jgi:hypothetical protein